MKGQRLAEETVKVSILLPIKNAEETLEETILTIITQDFTDFELLCIVAPSQDNSHSIAKNWASTDSRIKVFLDLTSSGIAGQCNYGLSFAKGKYIAICNADDLNMPNRLCAQINFLERHADVGVLGSDVLTFGKTETYWRMPSDSEEIKATMLFRGAIANPSAMFRRSTLLENNIKYDESFESAAEDLDFWVRLSKVTKMQNLNFPLIRYRIWDRQATNVNANSMLQNAARVRLKLLGELGIESFDENIRIHEAIANNESGLSKKQVMSWFEEITIRNQTYKIYDDEFLKLILERELFRIFTRNPISQSGRVYRFEWISKLLSKMPLTLKIKIARLMGM